MGKVKQIPFTPARLNNCQGDISKRWYIIFYAWNDDENRLIRKHDYDVNKIIKDSEEATRLAREEFAKQRIEKINKLLASGYSISTKKEKEIPQSRTLDELMRYALSIADISHNTYLSYSSSIEMFLTWCEEHNFSDNPISDFSQTDAIAYLDFRAQKGLKGKTVNRDMNYIKALWSLLEERKMVPDNIWKGIRKRKEVKSRKNIAFSDIDIQRLSEMIHEKDLELWDFINIIFNTFMRPNEIRQLQIYNIQLAQRKIYVDGVKSKNRKNEFVSIPDSLIDSLTRRIAGKSSNDYLFPGINYGSPISKNRMTSRHLAFLETLEISNEHTLYSWKHTGVVKAYLAGVDIKSIQLQCRHYSIAETDTYLKSLGLYANDEIMMKMPTLPI